MWNQQIHRKSRDVEWDVHCLTFSTFHRQAFFPGKEAAGWFLDALANARLTCPFRLFAYVIMPEHVHLVLQPLPGVAMSRILWHLKRPVTARAVDFVEHSCPQFLRNMADVQPSGKITHRFWQRGGGYDRNLRRSSDVCEKIGYVHDNPVRRQLVARAEDWPFSSAADWILKRPGPVTIDWDYVPEPELRQ